MPCHITWLCMTNDMYNIKKWHKSNQNCKIDKFPALKCYLLSQEEISCHRMRIHVAEQNFLWQE
jgi:hypothetical protein